MFTTKTKIRVLKTENMVNLIVARMSEHSDATVSYLRRVSSTSKYPHKSLEMDTGEKY